jgi:deoxycytidylate deaminase
MKRRRSQRQDVTAIAYDKRGNVLAVGRNSYVKTHPLQARMARRAGTPYKVYLHAEIAALIKARGRKVHKLVVFRVGKSGNMMNAEPCPVCKEAIKHFGVKHVHHT